MISGLSRKNFVELNGKGNYSADLDGIDWRDRRLIET